MKLKYPINIIFFGNTKYSVIVAKALHEKFGLLEIITIPDRPTGRKRQLTPNPVKKIAQENAIKLYETDKLDKSALEHIAEQNPDFLVVTDYRLILPKELLKIPKFAPLNVHHSLLPEYRGPSPVPSAILNGEKTSGVSIIIMSEKVDAGDILAQKKYDLKFDETTGSLLTALNTLGAQWLLTVIEDYLNNKVHPVGQDESKASYTQRFTKQDGKIDINNPPDPQTLDRMIRAYYPWPGVWTEIRIMNHESRVMNLKIKLLPGNLIQPEGKKPMSVKEFLNGYPQAKELLQSILPI